MFVPGVCVSSLSVLFVLTRLTFSLAFGLVNVALHVLHICCDILISHPSIESFYSWFSCSGSQRAHSYSCMHSVRSGVCPLIEFQIKESLENSGNSHRLVNMQIEKSLKQKKSKQKGPSWLTGLKPEHSSFEVTPVLPTHLCPGQNHLPLCSPCLSVSAQWFSGLHPYWMILYLMFWTSADVQFQFKAES